MSSQNESAWSRWEWTEQYQCEHRYRKNKKGDWEYDYRQIVAQEDYTRQTPRDREVDPPPLEVIAEVPEQIYNTDSLNYNSVDGVSQSFGQTSISKGEGKQPNPTISSAGKFTQGFNSRFIVPNNNPRKIYTENSGTKVDLDPSYKVYKSKEFYFGRIFKVLWSEPFGSGGTELTERFPAKYGENAYHSIRRFLIVDPKKGHSICLPILTYGGRGTLKHGVHPENHAMIHTFKKGTPDPLNKEKLTRRAIRVIPSSERYHLDPTSRLNYSKIYIVEHNVKVAFVGHVERKCEQTVVAVFNSLHMLPSRDLEDRWGDQDDSKDTKGQHPTSSNTQSWMPSTGQETASLYGSPATLPPSNMYPVSSEAYHSGGTYSLVTAWETRIGYNTSSYPSTEKATTPSASYPSMTGATEYHNASSAEHTYSRAPDTACEATDLGGRTQMTTYNVSGSVDQKKGGAYTGPTETAHTSLPTYSTTLGINQDPRESTGFPPEPQTPHSTSGAPSIRREKNHSSSSNLSSTDIGGVAQDRRGIVDIYLSDLASDTNGVMDIETSIPAYQNHEIPLDLSTVSSKPAAPTISRSSSNSSLESIMSMTPSMSSAASSIANLISGGQRLFSLLSNDEELSHLYTDAVEKVSFQRFEDNLRRCLVQFAAHVKEEAISTESLAAAKIVQRYSRNVAHMIREELELRASRVPATSLFEDDDQGVNPELEQEKRLQYQEQEDRDSDWDEKEESDQGDGPSNSVETEGIEGLLLVSNAFQMLRDNMKLFVNPDPVHKALFSVWPVKEVKSSVLEITYEVECEIVDFSQSYFPSGSPLGDSMTLTGASFDAHASTCRGHLATAWPNIGLLVLETFESLIVGNKDVQVENQYAKIGMQQTQSDGTRSKLSASVQADYNSHKEIMSSIAWLCSAVRYSASPHVSLSSTSIKANKKPNHKSIITIKLLDLEPIKSTNACWHALFPHAVIAKGFRVAPRQQGKGLDISFADMAMMSRSLSFVAYEDGLIVEGLRTLLIPVAELPEDNAIQWHFENKIKHSPRRTARISKIMKTDNLLNWHKELDPEVLAGRRCFLGWVEEAHIIIGTEDFSHVEVKWSGAQATPITRNVRTYSILLGVNILSIGTLQGTFASKETARQSSLVFPANKDILDSLADGCEEQVLVFDTGSKTGWYLPWSSIILYLAHKVIKRRGYQVYKGEEKCFLPFSSPGFDGGARASEVLKQSLNLRIRRLQSQRNNDEHPFSKMITELWHKLDHTRTEIDSKKSEFKLAGEIAPKYIHGVELMDFVEMKEGMKIKHAKVGQPWAHFTSLQPVVLFCKDFGQPIVPFQQRVICDLWSSVPPKLNYLVVTVAAVLYFLAIQEDEGCSRLGENIEWIIKSCLIQNHEHGNSDPIVHVQHLRSVKDATMDTRVLEIRDYSQGCLVFTDHKAKARCYGLLKSTMNEPPLPFTETVQKPLPDLPDASESASTSSVDSDHDMNGGLSQSISVSSCESDVSILIIQTKLVGSIVEQQTPDLAQMDDTRVEGESMHVSKNLASKGILNPQPRGLNLAHRQRNRKRQKAVLKRVEEAEAESSLISVRANKKLGDRAESIDGESSYCQQGGFPFILHGVD